MAKRTQAQTREATIGQRVMVARITGTDNRGKFLAFDEAEGIIARYFIDKAKASLTRGRVVRNTFRSQAKALYDWTLTKACPVKVKVTRSGPDNRPVWTFTPEGVAPASPSSLF